MMECYLSFILLIIEHRLANRSGRTMQRYIFDCREKMHESPKFLKRNHKVCNLPQVQCTSSPSNAGLAGCEYSKNKIFLTFDYSYYQSIPKTASMHVGNRINNLNSLIKYHEDEHGEYPANCRHKTEHDDQNEKIRCESQQMANKFRRGSINAPHTNNGDKIKDLNYAKSKKKQNSIKQSKWTKERENLQTVTEKSQKKVTLLKGRKKIRVPQNSMPGVGDYYFESKNIQKRIVYDVKIRGKPSNYIKPSCSIEGLIGQEMGQGCNQSISYCASPRKHILGEISMNSPPTAIKVEQRQPRNSKSAPGNPHGQVSSGKPMKSQIKLRQNEQQYNKFISAIDVTNVWKKLMEKHRLKGSKFDIYSNE